MRGTGLTWHTKINCPHLYIINKYNNTFYLDGFSFQKEQRSHCQLGGMERTLVQEVKSGPPLLKQRQNGLCCTTFPNNLILKEFVYFILFLTSVDYVGRGMYIRCITTNKYLSVCE